MEDTNIIQEILNGNTEIFELLVNKYKNKLYTYLFYLSKDKIISEDLLQETFIKCYINLKSYDTNKSSFYTWISTISYNVFIDYKRKNNVVHLPIEEQLIEEVTYMDEGINEYLISLKYDYREVLILKYYSGFSYIEISEILSIPVNTVKTRITRAKTHLKEIIRKEECVNV